MDPSALATLGAYLGRKAADIAWKRVTEYLAGVGATSAVAASDIDHALARHLSEVERWSSEISFVALRRPRLTKRAFVPLDVFLQPRRLHLDQSEREDTLPLYRALQDNIPGRHVVVLGQAGSGKTTSMKHLCQRLLHESAYLKDRFSCPLVVRFRDVAAPGRRGALPDVSDELVAPALLQILGFRIQYPQHPSRAEPEAASFFREMRLAALAHAINALRALIVLDGFDEIPTTDQREATIREVQRLAEVLTDGALVLTSRPGEFPFHVEGAAQFEIAPFSGTQVTLFARRWLGRKAPEFLLQLRQSAFHDTATRPLAMAHLCAIYEKYGDIPPAPKTVHRRILRLLVRDWDDERSIRRVSREPAFTPDRKEEFLAHLAYDLTTRLRASVFSRNDLTYLYSRIHHLYELSPHATGDILAELESHTGLFIQSGYDAFEFAHRSLQEFLTAEHLVRLPSIPHDPDVLLTLPAELAIAVAISSDPTSYFTELVLERIKAHDVLRRHSFVRVFVDRLRHERPIFEPGYGPAVAALSLYSSACVQGGSLDQPALGRWKEVSVLDDLLVTRVTPEQVLAVYEAEPQTPGSKTEGMTFLRRKPGLRPDTWSDADSAAKRLLLEGLSEFVCLPEAMLSSPTDV